MSNQKVALITGSSRGIGREIAIHLANLGYAVVVNYNSSDADAIELSKILLQMKASHIIVKADVGEPEGMKYLREQVEAKFGRLDVLINNAGQIIRPGNWDMLSDNDTLRTIKTNLLSVIYSMREFVPLLRAGGGGNIINVVSTYAYNGAAAVLAYTSSKAAVISLTKAMALELASDQIRVNGIAPGNFETDMTTSGGQGLIDWVISTTPLKRLGNPMEIATCVDFLIQSSFITGHIINIDGGQLLVI